MPLSLSHLVSTTKNWGTKINQSVERLGAKIPSISATCFFLINEHSSDDVRTTSLSGPYYLFFYTHFNIEEYGL